MQTVTVITWDDLQGHLVKAENSETIDLGTVNLHVVRTNEGRTLVLVENPANDDGNAVINTTA